MVESMGGLKSSCSVRRIQKPNFEAIDARIASALNRIIHNTQFKNGQSGGTKSPKRGPLPSWKTDCSPDLHFRVTESNDSVENCADLITIVLRNNDNQEFDSKCDGIFIFNDKNPI